MNTFSPSGITDLRPAQDWDSFSDSATKKAWLAAATFGSNGQSSSVDVQYISETAPDTLINYKSYPVDPNATLTVPPGLQSNCSGNNCEIDSNATMGTQIISVFAQYNVNSADIYVFTAFPVGVKNSPTTSAIDMFALDFTSGVTAFKVETLNSDVLAFPSVVANQGQGLYLNYSNFGSSHDPQSQAEFYNYIPLGQGFQFQSRQMTTNSPVAYTGGLNPATGLQRWGDYTAASWVWNVGNTWPASYYLLDQFTETGLDTTLQITSFP